jgi:hypothetical protein
MKLPNAPAWELCPVHALACLECLGGGQVGRQEFNSSVNWIFPAVVGGVSTLP